MKRVDERDLMFSRMNRKEGTPEYDAYYTAHPDKKEIDDKLRTLPGLSSQASGTYNKLISPLVSSTFNFLADLNQLSEGTVKAEKREVTPEIITAKLKGLAGYYGADLVGVASINPDFYYSHRGRKTENYGEEVTACHKYAIVFAVELDKGMIDRAPLVEAALETTKGYLQAAVIGMALSYYLRELGHDARNHMDGNYLLPLTQVAQEAGLGEIGRIGLLIAKEFGPRIRLGAVTTDLELLPDKKSSGIIKEFCKSCNRCAKSCPAKAISQNDPQKDEKMEYWQTNGEKCFGIWQKIGTDCGICLSVCPFSRGIDGKLLDKFEKDEKGISDFLKGLNNGKRKPGELPADWLKEG